MDICLARRVHRERAQTDRASIPDHREPTRREPGSSGELFRLRPQPTRAVIVVVLFTAIVTTALAFVALMWSQARVTAVEAAVMLAAEPLSASITSVVFYGEPLTRALVIGAALILAAMVLSQSPPTPNRDPIPP